MEEKLNFVNYLVCALLAALLVIIGTHAISFAADDVDLKSIEQEISVNLENDMENVDYDDDVDMSGKLKATQLSATTRRGDAIAHTGNTVYVNKRRNNYIVNKEENRHSVGLGVTLLGGVSKPILANKFITTKPVAGIGLDIKIARNIGLEGNAMFTRYDVSALRYDYSRQAFFTVTPTQYYADWDPNSFWGTGGYGIPYTYGHVIEIDSAREVDFGGMLRYELVYDSPLVPYVAGGFGYHKTQYLGSLWYQGDLTPNSTFSQTTITADVAAGLKLRLGSKVSLDGRAKYEGALMNQTRYRSYMDKQFKANDRERFQILGGISFEM